MGSGSMSDLRSHMDSGDSSYGIIPRVIHDLFEMIQQKETDDPTSTYRVHVQFLEIYGEDIRDLLDPTKTSKVTIRETAEGEVFVSGAREEVVSSAAQMMKTLDDGTRHRMTASTLMNISSSRSHAIFTVFLEHTIHTSAVVTVGNLGIENTSGGKGSNGPLLSSSSDHNGQTDTTATAASAEDGPSQTMHSREIRRCKFTFVDLAGSERAKRTGAQGLQLKEGIDINKGLLALGNVISALGDDTKRGKVHVPYRVSKITRILQDSLGGNSKTLMICCVSPSAPSFYESLNALRYANRARNIQNKPVVNRDPTLVLIDELKRLVLLLAGELHDVRTGTAGATPEGVLSVGDLETILSSGAMRGMEVGKRPSAPTTSTSMGMGVGMGMGMGVGMGVSVGVGCSSRPAAAVRPSALTARRPGTGGSVGSCAGTDAGTGSREDALSVAKELAATTTRADEAEFEVRRLTDQLKVSRVLASELSEQAILVQSERDFYCHKWADACPAEARLVLPQGAEGCAPSSPDHPDHPDHPEKDKMAAFAAQYLREIEALRRQLAEQQELLSTAKESSLLFEGGEGAALVEAELSANVAQVIAQTERQLLQEAQRLRRLGAGGREEYDEDLPASPYSTLSLPSSPYPSVRDALVADDGEDGRPPTSRIEEDEMAYQRRQKLMSDEVVSLGEQLQLKETLLGQLRRSQHQYGVMKAFYEQKLATLNEEMNQKQSERDRLEHELEDLERNTSKLETEAYRQKNEQERRLRGQLQKKEEELRLLKRRQEELSNLSRVQSRYQSQVVSLEKGIDMMRKQKVDLTKSLQCERKKHFAMLTMKAREIDRLKHELTTTAGETKRLSRDKQRAEERVKEALRDTAAMRKKVNDAQRYGSMAPSESNSGRLAKRTCAVKNAPPAKRVLSEEELRVKKWLDRRIQDINAREEAAEGLRKQCEQQLALLSRKEALEKEKHTIQQTALSLRDVIVEGGGSDQGGLSRGEEEALQEIEDRLDSVEGQLRLRHRNISEIEDQLTLADEAALPEKTLEALKRSSAGSLPAAHEVIRLLFDMLVGAKSAAQQRRAALARAEAKERQLRADLDEGASRMAALARAHDMEVTRAANEYEEKLQGLFTHSAMGRVVFQESGMQREEPSSPRAAAEEARSLGSSPTHLTSAGWSTPDNGHADVLMRYHPRSLPRPEGGEVLEATDMRSSVMLEVAVEQTKLLRARLDRESTRNNYLQERVADLDTTRQQLQRELEEKAIHVRFLEDERQLFKEMADDLRAGMASLGGAGMNVLKQVRGASRRADVEDEEEDTDTDSVLGAFDSLGDVITRTGSVTGAHALSAAAVASATTSPIADRPDRHNSPPRPPVGAGAGAGSIYDRLTNPSNFTGAMKNVFEQDLAQKRQKVQLIKSGQFTRKDKDSSVGFVFLNPRAEARNAQYVSNNGSDNEDMSHHPALQGVQSLQGVQGPPPVLPGQGHKHVKRKEASEAPVGEAKGEVKGLEPDAPARGGESDVLVKELTVFRATISPIKVTSPVMTPYPPLPPTTADYTYALSPRAFETSEKDKEKEKEEESGFSALGLGTALTNWFRSGTGSGRSSFVAEEGRGSRERDPSSVLLSAPLSASSGGSLDEYAGHLVCSVDDLENERPPVVTPTAPTHTGAAAAPRPVKTAGASASATAAREGRRQSYAATLKELRGTRAPLPSGAAAAKSATMPGATATATAGAGNTNIAPTNTSVKAKMQLLGGKR